MKLRTKEEARGWFTSTGTKITDWARDHGFNTKMVYHVLRGDVQGQRGESHKIAVALKLKPEPPGLWVDPEDETSTPNT